MRRAALWIALLALVSAGPGRAPARSHYRPPSGVCLRGQAQSAISPDGRRLAFVGTDSLGADRLWVLPLGGNGPPLPGIEGASYPFWSPDGRDVGFFAGGKLMRVASEGGRPRVLCDAEEGHGGAWSRKGAIVFAPAAEGPLFAVDARGGPVRQVTHLDSVRWEDPEESHGQPRFLPDGKHFLFTAQPPVEGLYVTWAGSLEGGPARLVVMATSAAVFAPPSDLLFARGPALVTQKLDLATLEPHGPEKGIEDVICLEGGLGDPTASVSDNGVLAVAVSASTAGLEWFDASGVSLGGVPMMPGPYTSLALSPDGRRAAMLRFVSASESDVWVVDLTRGIGSRFNHEVGLEMSPAWSPDGTRLAFWAKRAGAWQIVVKPLAGGDEKTLHVSDRPPGGHLHWSPDGGSLVFDTLGKGTRSDLWVLDLAESRARSWRASRFDETDGSLSRDGRWMAYVSDETGRREVWVESFPAPGTRRRISTVGGSAPMWRGAELIFTGPGGEWAAAVGAGGAPRAAAVLRPGIAGEVVGHDVTADGAKRLVLRVREDARAGHTIIRDWRR